MADKIVLTGPKKVQVNENGDYITFDSRDSAFMDKLLEIVQEFEANREQYQSKIDEISTMPADSTQEQVAKSLAASKLNAEICGRLRDKIDSAFHDTV